MFGKQFNYVRIYKYLLFKVTMRRADYRRDYFGVASENGVSVEWCQLKADFGCLGSVLQNCNLSSQSALKLAPFGSVSVVKHVFMLEHEATRQAMALAVPTHLKTNESKQVVVLHPADRLLTSPPSRSDRNFEADAISPLIGSGGVAEMCRMVEFHTDFTQNDRS